MNVKISSLYTLGVEDICVKLLYFFNTINTYCLIAGISAFFIVNNTPVEWIAFIVILVAVIALNKTSDFYPLFLVPTIPAMIFVTVNSTQSMWCVGKLLLANALFYYCVLFSLMVIPESIVARDYTKVAIRKLWNTVITVAPTSVSLSMSLFFSTYLSFALYYKPGFHADDGLNGVVFWMASIVGALLAYFLKPRTYVSKFMKPPIKNTYFKRVVVLNIDGCRMDVLREALNNGELPNIRKAIGCGTSYPDGLTTVYRALTNPAFASILTGAVPEVHGIKDNNIGKEIKVEGLPDIVSTILYGSMHVKHFSKKSWKTRIVSLPRHSVYRSDAVVQETMFNDLLYEKDVRLFVMDYSEADFLGHAYGSKSSEYRIALQRVDSKIGDVFSFLDKNDMSNDTAVIICSDHGIVAIDHSYLLFKAEKYVPFIAVGKDICEGKELRGEASIMDIGVTISYLLGVRYPSSSRGRVFVEMLKEVDGEKIKEEVVSNINEAYYESVATQYDVDHPEVCEGDMDWWVEQIKKIAGREKRAWRVLDFGCGTGLVGKAWMRANQVVERFVCYDVSSEMLGQAKNALSDDVFYFTDDFSEICGQQFDIICINSVLHHVHDVKKCIQILKQMLNQNGYILGGHEPNRAFFNSGIVRMLARVYKIFGGGFDVPKDVVTDINDRLSKLSPPLPSVTNVDILQTVENHSPIEQSLYGIDRGKGFDKGMFINEFFNGMKVHLVETYTTAFIRKRFQRILFIRPLGEFIFYRLFGSGNLIRYVFQKS